MADDAARKLTQRYDLEAGAYRLEFSITDNIASKTLTSSQDFTVQ